MAGEMLKITYYHVSDSATKKLNAFLQMPSNKLDDLRHDIKRYLFQERELPVCNFRTYWIDSDSDEIEIINQNDYGIFLAKCEKNMHLHIAACLIDDDPTNFIIHEGIACDSCKALPLVGFRYKCMVCPNFDLCQACESAHKHPEHFMVRMPTNNGPKYIDTWKTGEHYFSRSLRDESPFKPETTNEEEPVTALVFNLHFDRDADALLSLGRKHPWGFFVVAYHVSIIFV